MTPQTSSLITANAKSGLDLANELAEHLQSQMESAGEKISRPGGTNYLKPQQIPKEIMASVLFYAIAMANQGWAGQKA